jgi:hypothetical protein
MCHCRSSNGSPALAPAVTDSTAGKNSSARVALTLGRQKIPRALAVDNVLQVPFAGMADELAGDDAAVDDVARVRR